MAIIIKGDNKGIAVDGDLKIDHLDFQFGHGVKSASGVHRSAVDAEVVGEMTVIDDRENNYPEITDKQRNFFETAFVIKGNGQKPSVQDMPVGFIMHTVYDLTKEWDPSQKTSVHKWKVLYEVLRRLKYFRVEQKHRYAEYVKAVVRYSFPTVADSYSNNISKSQLSDSFEEWRKDDKGLYKNLKEALSYSSQLP